MSGYQLLNLLLERRLLPTNVIEHLREQVGASDRSVTAEAVAKVLVDSGHLTAFQARQLIAREEDDVRADPHLVDEPELIGDTAQDASTGNASAGNASADGDDEWQLNGDELELVPIDEDKKIRFVPGSTSDKDTRPRWRDESEPVHLVDWLDEELTHPGEPEVVTVTKRSFWTRRQTTPDWVRPNRWDSPLMLVGGGVLAVLVLVAIALTVLMNRGHSEELLEQADSEYEAGSYSQAILSYKQFIDDHPNHDQISRARVRHGLSRLRQAMHSSDDARRWFRVARDSLSDMEDEPEFVSARSELASILPEIAMFLADAAQAAEDPQQRQATLDLAETALSWVHNTKYVPKSLFPGNRVDEIQDRVAMSRRSLQRNDELERALSEIALAVEDENTDLAYQIRKKLLHSFPELATAESLQKVVRTISVAEQTEVAALDGPLPSQTEEAASVVERTVTLIQRHGPDRQSKTAIIAARGAAYEMDAASGRVLWRRYLGMHNDSNPVRLEKGAEGDVLLTDSRAHELLRVASRSGELVWRLPVGSPFATPLVFGDRVYVACRDGRLLAVDQASGMAPTGARLPQALPVGPAIDGRTKAIYQPANHSSLYVLSLDSLRSQSVYHLGHAAGSIRVAPIVVRDFLIVVENLEDATARLNVLSLASESSGLSQLQELPLIGHVWTQPIISSGRLVVSTDRGQLAVFDVRSTENAVPLTKIAERVATEREPWIRYVASHLDELWVADNQLSRLVIQASRGRLLPRGVELSHQGDAFDHPLQVVDGVLIHVRTRLHRPGVRVSGVDVKTGGGLWENQIAVPPAGEPFRIHDQSSLAVVTSTAGVFSTGLDWDGSVLEQPLDESDQDLPAVLNRRIDFGPEQTLFSAADGGQVLLQIRHPENVAPTKEWLHLDIPLSCPPRTYKGGLLLPVTQGESAWVEWFHPLEQRPLALPFQPPLVSGRPIKWRRPTNVPGEESQFLISDGVSKIYRVGVTAIPQIHLGALAESADTREPLISPLAVVADSVYAVGASGYLHTFELSDLALRSELDIQGPPVWGPRQVGPLVMIGTADDHLLCLDGSEEPRWRIPLSQGTMVGAPWLDGEQLVLSTTRGRIWWLDAASGQQTAVADTGQPLGTGPIKIGPHWLATGHDSTLMVLKKPDDNKK